MKTETMCVNRKESEKISIFESKPNQKKSKTFVRLLCLSAALFYSFTMNAIGPSIINLIYNPTAQQYEKYELSFDLTIDYSSLPYNFYDPYDPAIIDVYAIFTSPNGTVYKQNAFYYKFITQTATASGQQWPYDTFEGLTVNSTPGKWKVRFSPTEVGQWSFKIQADDHINTIVPGALYLFNSAAAAAGNHGFIKAANQRFLKFSDGTPFYPVGLSNYGFHRPYQFTPLTPEFGAYEVMKTMDTYAQNNINYMRFEANTPEALNIFGYDLNTNTNHLRSINQTDAFQLDEIMDYAKQKGIYVELAVFAHTFFGDTGYYGNCKWHDYNPFNSNVALQPAGEPAGPCLYPYDFFTDPTAQLLFKNILRYMEARWGYSTYLMSYELMDEADGLAELNQVVNPRCPSAWQQAPSNLYSSLVPAWHSMMKNYLNSIDPYQRLVTTAFATPSYNSVVIPTMSLMDYSQIHRYGDFIQYSQSNTLFLEVQAVYPLYYKPCHIGETSGLNFDPWIARSVDPTFYSAHCTQWSSMFNGGMGPTGYWDSWDFINPPNQNDPANTESFANFVGIGNYSKTLPQLGEQFYPTNASNSVHNLYYLKNYNGDKIYGWIQDKNFDWNSIYNNPAYQPYFVGFNQNDRPPLIANSNALSFTVSKLGKYTVKWFNTSTGIVYQTQMINASASYQLTLSAPLALFNLNYGDAGFTIEYDCASHWNCGVLNQNAPQNILAGSPLVAKNQQVFFIGSDLSIHELYWNGNLWFETALNINAPHNVRPDSDIGLDQNNNIYFIGDDSRMHKMYWNTTSWQEMTLKNNAPQDIKAGSSIAIDASSNVYYTGNDDRIHQYYYDGANWQTRVLNISAPQNVLNKSDLAVDGLGRVDFIGMDFRIHQMYLVSGIWFERTLNIAAPTNVRHNATQSLSSLAVDPTNNSVFFTDVYNTIHQMVFNGSIWLESSLTSPGILVRGGDYRNTTVADIYGNKVYYFAGDNRVHEYYKSGSIWLETVNNSNDPNNVSSGLCTDEYGFLYYASSTNRAFSCYWDCWDIFARLPAMDNTEDQILSEEPSVNIYPNPSSGEFYIDLKNAEIKNGISVQVYDMIGNLVMNKEYDEGGILNLDLSFAQNGIYLVRIIYDNNVISKRLLIQK